MTDRQINKWLRRQFSGICWLLLGYYTLMNILVYVTAAMDILKQLWWQVAIGRFPFDMDSDALMQNAWGYILSIGVAGLILFAWTGRAYWKQTVFRKEKSMSGLVFLGAVFLCMGSQMLNSFWVAGLEAIMNSFGKSLIPMLEYVSGGTASVSMFLYAAVLAPMSEEVIFRGVILRSLQPYGKRFAILFSAMLFGLFHGNLLQGPYAFLVGLILGYLACEYSINWAIALHIFNNLVLSEGMNWLAANLPEPMASGVQIGLLGTFLVVSIVLLFRKRGEIQAYRHSEWMDRRCVKCFLTSFGFWVFALIMAVNMAVFFAG